MIMRLWRGLVPAAKKQAYVDYLHRTGLADYAATPGNLGVALLCREQGDLVEFVTMTRWDSVDSIKAFAGDDHMKARYYPEDDQFLVSKEVLVEHYEVLF